MTDSRNTTNPLSNDDPIVALANEIAACHKQATELLRTRKTDRSDPSTDKDAKLDRLYDRIYAARDELTGLKAQSVEGAVVQLAAASNIFSNIGESPLGSEDRRTALILYRRLVYSAIAFLCEDSGIEENEMALPLFLEPHLDPWKLPSDLPANVIRLYEPL